MRRLWIAMIGLLGLLASPASAQLYLQVKSSGPQPYEPQKLVGVTIVGTNTAAKPPERGPGRNQPPMPFSSQRRSSKPSHELLTINLRNMLATEGQYLVQYFFFCSPVESGRSPKLKASGSQNLTLKPNGASSLRISSPPYEKIEVVEETRVFVRQEYGPARQQTERRVSYEGEKSGGYVVRVLSDGKIVAVDASSADLKQEYAKTEIVK